MVAALLKAKPSTRLRPGTGKSSCVFNSPQPRLAGPWSGGPRSCSWTCKGPSSASFLFAFQLSSLGQAAFHESGLGAPAVAVHAEARLEKSGAQSGSAGACAAEDSTLRTPARLRTVGTVVSSEKKSELLL